MTSMVDALRQAASVIAAAEIDRRVHAVSDDELMDVVAAAGALLRRVEGALVEGVGEIADRSRSIERDARLTTRMGYRNVSELVQHATRCSGASAARFERAAVATAPNWGLFSADEHPAKLPALRDALLEGAVGVDGVLAIAQPLLAMRDRAPRKQVLTADEVLAAMARGEGPDAAPPACADDLRVHAQVWAVLLDPDGDEPTGAMAARRRGITLGRTREGTVPIRGELLPEIAAQLVTIADATGSPRVRFAADGDPAALDDRTASQKLHDALATALTVAAASRDLPTLGGAAPTLVISVREEELTTDAGWAHAGDTPVPLAAARHAGCAGVVQRIALDTTGRIRRLGTEERLFNRHQRRAIALRDGGCVIPGCTVPPSWCEIHHVTEHAAGGPTHTANGVLLCWHHHRFIDTGPWRIRMNRGVPEVQAPRWYDRDQVWRPTTTSPTRMHDAVIRRT